MRALIKTYIYKYNNAPVALKASIVFLMVNLLQKGLGFITSPIFVRIMSSDQYGLVSIYNADNELIGTIATFALAAGCFDVGMQDYKADRNRFAFSCLILSNFITIVTFSFLFLSFPLLHDYLKINRFLLIVMFLNTMFSQSFILWTRKERYAYRYRIPGLLTAVTSIVSSIFTVMCVYYSNNYKVETKIVIPILIMLPVNIFFWIYLGKCAGYEIKKEYIRFAFFFNLPLMPHYISSYILSSFDRLMIANIIGSSQAAYYSIAYNLAAIVSIIWAAINSSLVPFVLDKYEKKEYKEVSDHVLPILTIFGVICLLIICMAPEVIKIIGTSEYYGAMYAIPPIVGGVFFQALYYIFTNVLYYYKKPQYVLVASLSAAIINIILNYFGLNLFGYIAAAYTTLICYLLQATLDYLISLKIVGQNIYDMRYLCILSIIVIVITIVANFLYSFVVLRWIIVVALLILLFYKRNVFLKIEKT